MKDFFNELFLKIIILWVKSKLYKDKKADKLKQNKNPNQLRQQPLGLNKLILFGIISVSIIAPLSVLCLTGNAGYIPFFCFSFSLIVNNFLNYLS